MKKIGYHSVWRLFAALMFSPLIALSQGPLTPPGPPAPTMRTLLQIEPRTPIETIPYTITNSGSYYLTGDLVGNGSQSGIVIEASAVTIDLKGFSVANCSVGISINSKGPISGISIYNGFVRGCGGNGIDLAGASKCRLEQVMVCDNRGAGAVIGNASIVTLCTASGNRAGLVVYDGSSIFNCVVQSNRTDGMVIASHSRVADNVCEANGEGGIYAGIHVKGMGNRVERNNANRNDGFGFQIENKANLVVQNNACFNTTKDYQIDPGNNYGQILSSPGSNFVNSNPWANFSCAENTPPPECTTDMDCAHLTGTCRRGVCQNNVCQAVLEAAGTICSDGNACTINDACDGMGSCNGTPRVCDDGNACTSDGCDGMTGACYSTVLPNNSPCPGGLCQNGTCVPTGCANDQDCSHLNTSCSMGVCSAGACQQQPRPVGFPCPNGTCNGMGMCNTPSCTDGIKNGSETGVDCGGGNCPPCGVGQACLTGNDCASGVCQGGFCQQVCPSGQQLCNGSCVNVTTDISNCGGCGLTCPVRPNTTPVCSGAQCSFFCNPGFSDCNGNPMDGCEVAIQSNPQHCGACNTLCQGAPNSSVSCVNGNCNYTCNSGFANCDGNLANGCEIAVNTNVNNCGGCGMTCPTRPNSTRVCNGGQCTFICNTGFLDCNGNPFDGCEINRLTDDDNCGSCGNACNIFTSCNNGVCN